VERLTARRAALEESCAAREAILESNQSRSGGGAAPSADARMRAVAAKSRLAAIAKAQAQEIELMRREVQRLRQRSVPIFQ
jgi:hypothetical protein